MKKQIVAGLPKKNNQITQEGISMSNTMVSKKQ